MEFLGRLFSLASIPLMLLGVWGIVRQVNKERVIRLASPLIGIFMSPAMLLFNVLVLRQAGVTCVGPLFLVLGLGFGLAWGMTMRLNLRDGRVIGKQSILHLVFWGMSYAITQLLTVFAPASWVAGGLVLMFFSTGTTLGTNLNLIARQMRLQLAPRPAIQLSEPLGTRTSSMPPTLPK